ncbi:hypothetical protein B0A49_08935 [Cryomyces minteri]|uniref:FAD-binding domain-containing protein n=1 Tax=Cryomyces minteri TaxID=331657 RepID=A0A4U0WTK6_9PEZI|nr:hypothetical protein B0A49_08935 [Cryomyces minteri]
MMLLIQSGPGGLTLARLLQRNHFVCEVYERDVSTAARPYQGSSLDLHTASGQQALKEAGLLDEFNALSRPEGEAFRVCDAATAKIKFKTKPPKPGKPNKPEIDRLLLRNLLLDSLLPGTVHWGKQLDYVEQVGQTHILHFANEPQSESEFDLVVGADGAWSRVRAVLSPEFPIFSGVTAIEAIISKDLVRSDVNELFGHGSLIANRGTQSLWCQRQGDGGVSAAQYMRTPEGWVAQCGINWEDSETARVALVDRHMSEGWTEIFRHMILGSGAEIWPRALYMMPVGWRWNPKPGVTLLGDAAHLMTPFAGVGVNLAMEDALELSRALLIWGGDGRESLTEAIAEYERPMFERAQVNAALTWKNLVRNFGAHE